MTTPPRVSVVVPHFQDPASLDKCLSALVDQDFPRDAFEIVVADNNSPCGREVVEAAIAGRARLTIVTDKGAGPARNGGVAAARGEILAFTDSDCLPEPGWLSAGVAALSGCDFAGGRMVVLVADPAHLTGPEAFERVFAFDNRTYVLTKGFTVTANLFTTRAVFDKVGPFRTGVSEDLEWSHRARDMGYRIGYAAEAVVGHPARRSWAELKGKWRRLDSEMHLFYGQGRGGGLKRLVHALALPISAVAHSPRVLTSPALETPGQRASALATLYRLRFWRFTDTLRLILRGHAT